MIDLEKCYQLCDDCPMSPDFTARIRLGELYGREPATGYAWCDKTGGKFAVCGYCGDAFEEKMERQRKGERPGGRAYRRARARLKDMQRKEIIAQGPYGSPRHRRYNPAKGWFKYYTADREPDWEKEGNYIMYPKDSNYQRFLKRQSNKKIRRYHGGIPSGGSYKKLFDYWWELY